MLKIPHYLLMLISDQRPTFPDHLLNPALKQNVGTDLKPAVKGIICPLDLFHFRQQDCYFVLLALCALWLWTSVPSHTVAILQNSLRSTERGCGKGERATSTRHWRVPAEYRDFSGFPKTELCQTPVGLPQPWRHRAEDLTTIFFFGFAVLHKMFKSDSCP